MSAQHKNLEIVSKPDVKTKFMRSDELFGRDKVILIQHGENIYRLMKTRNGKLILNK
jgi:hemin uptake protein HemP